MVRHTDWPGAATLGLNVDGSVDEFYQGDALRLSQVLVNLLTNAAKFSPPSGPVRFDIGATSDAPGSHLLTFAVADVGPGMTPEQVGRLFQPFEQVGTLGQQKNGTGLGLAISQRLVHAMGGSIQVCSAPGRGSTFTFSVRLPRWSNPALDQAEVQPSSGGADLTGCVVLIVDDNDIGRELAAELLSEAGARVIPASHGEEALDLLERINVSVVVTDCQMPEMDGYALTRAIRLDPRWHDIPIIGLSGNAGQAERDKAIQIGMDDYLTKPVEPDRLRDAIRWWSKD
jgi:CheY-like chemotaxis protein